MYPTGQAGYGEYAGLFDILAAPFKAAISVVKAVPKIAIKGANLLSPILPGPIGSAAEFLDRQLYQPKVTGSSAMTVPYNPLTDPTFPPDQSGNWVWNGRQWTVPPVGARVPTFLPIGPGGSNLPVFLPAPAPGTAPIAPAPVVVTAAPATILGMPPALAVGAGLAALLIATQRRR